MRAVEIFLVLCVATLVPIYGTPTPAYDVLHLQQPSAEDIAQAVLNVNHLPFPEATPMVDVKLPENANHRIMYGELAEEGQFPYQVALIAQTPEGQYFCGGSITEYDWILTAAHCVPQNAQWILVFAGSTKWRQAPYQIYASSAVIHGDYNGSWLWNDIALIKLSSPLSESGTVKKVGRETKGCGDDTLDGELAVVSGWGRTDFEAAVQDNLRWVITRIITNGVCYNYYGPTIIDSSICSVSDVGRDGVLCSGDSGGPLVWIKTGRQIGINSFVSSGGCNAGPPSGYARVPCQIEWIEAVLNSSLP